MNIFSPTFRMTKILWILIPVGVFFALFSCENNSEQKTLKEAILLIPENDDTGISTNTLLSWSGDEENQGSIRYDLYLGETTELKTEQRIASNLISLFYAIPEDKSLDPGKLYYWRVVSRIDGTQNSSKVRSFRTKNSAKAVSGISFDKDFIELSPNTSTELRASISPKDATKQQVKWRSSNSKVAIISDIVIEGENQDITEDDSQILFSLESVATILATGTGTTVITAITKDGSYTATASVNVTIPSQNVEGLVLNRDNFILDVGASETLAATVIPSTASNNLVQWYTSNEAIATITSEGTVVGKSAGKVIIKAVSVDGNRSAEVVVTVINPVIHVTSINIENTSLTVVVSESVLIEAKVFPNNATNPEIIYTSNTPGIVSVAENGLVTGLKNGKGRVGLRSSDGDFIEIVDVEVISNPIQTTGVRTQRGIINLVLNRKTQVVASVEPSDATNKSLRWGSDDENIVIINSDGELTAVGTGTTNIIVTTVNNGYSTRVQVNVSSTDPNRPTLDNLPAKQIHKFVYNGHLYYIVNLNKTWVSAASYGNDVALNTGEYIHLVHINDILEERAVHNAINDATNLSNPNMMVFNSNSLGNKTPNQYIWLGGTDNYTEGTWVWDGDNNINTQNELIGTGEGFISTGTWTSSGSTNNNWGKTPNGQQQEPDNGQGQSNVFEQNFMGLGLEDWSYGNAFEWNDISGSNEYPFILEIE